MNKEHLREHDAQDYRQYRRPWYVALLIVGLLLLAGSTYLAVSGRVFGFEHRVFEAVNNIPSPEWVTSKLAKPISNAVWGMVGLVILLLAVPKFRFRAWQYAAAGGGAYVMGTILEHIIARARPSGLYHDFIVRAVQGGPGFPSDHTAVVAGLGLTIWPYVSWPMRIVALGLIIGVGWSRVYLGVHAPLDVVGGLAVGMVVVATIHLLPEKLRRWLRLAA